MLGNAKTSPELLHRALDHPPPPTIVELGRFVANDLATVANSFEAWDSIPIFAFGRQLVRKLRTADGKHGDTCRIAFERNGRRCSVDVSPAQLLDRSGKTQRAHYPGPAEELVVEVLYKLAAEHGHGFQPAPGVASVLFSHAMIRRHLKAHGHSRNHRDISLSIEILQGARIAVREEGRSDPIYLGAVLPQVFPARRAARHSQEKLWIAELPAPVAEAIGDLSYRQISYSRVMAFKAPLAKWIYKRMVARWIQASMVNDYHFSARLLDGSGLLQHGRALRRRQIVVQALEELKARGVIMCWDVRHTYGGRAGRQVVDSVYTIHATPAFVAEQKAANKRARLARTSLAEGTFGRVRHETEDTEGWPPSRRDRVRRAGASR